MPLYMLPKVLVDPETFLVVVSLTREAIVIYFMAFSRLLLTNTTNTAAYLEQECDE